MDNDQNKRNVGYTDEERRNRVDKDDVEFAQAYGTALPDNQVDRLKNRDDDVTGDKGRGLGITGLILSIIAFFIWPFILAPAGIIIGAISIRRGSSYGWWAVGIGLVALVFAVIAFPFRLIF
ncbi:DUF4190 domain-containing protein [Thermoflavimicrobium daqui]|uniref:DUF4190 domain-containing protein n=1 Tax=Thermoflavimicrobium daqui TaxID=2137476 RepID=A0A364K6H8_9BACL|nr:DUF4190 domain-containing protein [Thermoflavimicrobium daqui]RAL25905.1 hypothetical protein DL897_07465 [Thermoflavimicrobium daqui]